MWRVFLFAFLASSGPAADWLCARGDAQASGWQKQGSSINPRNAGDLQLLWKLKLDNQSKGSHSLTTPVMLGPIVTHRGIKELVFAAGADDNLYAVDADRGRLFWKRHFDVQEKSDVACDGGLTGTPVLAPPPHNVKVPRKKVRTVDDDEFGTPLRPLYIAASDGVVHTIRPSDGVDMAPALPFVPAHANPSALIFASRILYAATSSDCNGAPSGIWSIDTASDKAKPAFRASRSQGTSVAGDGTIYASTDLGIVALDASSLKQKWAVAVPNLRAIAPLPFEWNGRPLLAVAGTQAQVFLYMRTAEKTPLAISAPLPDLNISGLATWVDAKETRWIYAGLQGPRGKIVAFKVVDRGGIPTLAPAWTSRAIPTALPPVVFNGVLLVLNGGDAHLPATLYALDAASGKELYASGDAVDSFVDSSGLAVANGHICFGTANNTLYCFGFPIEM